MMNKIVIDLSHQLKQNDLIHLNFLYLQELDNHFYQFSLNLNCNTKHFMENTT